MNHLQYAGYNCKHNSDFIYDQPHGQDSWLLLLTHTPALFLVGGELKEYPSKSFILYPPHHRIYYRASGEYYENDWLRLDSDDSIVTSFPIQGRPFSIADTEYCHKLFQLLSWEHYLDDNKDNQVIQQLLSILFTKLNSTFIPENPHPYYEDLLHLRKLIYNNPQHPWTVPDMAKMLHISVGYLQNIYKEFFQISCMNDVIANRIRLAKDYLLNTKQTIGEISEHCGYNNVEHFCRQFKETCDQTPGDFRNKGETS